MIVIYLHTGDICVALLYYPSPGINNKHLQFATRVTEVFNNKETMRYAAGGILDSFRGDEIKDTWIFPANEAALVS